VNSRSPITSLRLILMTSLSVLFLLTYAAGLFLGVLFLPLRYRIAAGGKQPTWTRLLAQDHYAFRMSLFAPWCCWRGELAQYTTIQHCGTARRSSSTASGVTRVPPKKQRLRSLWHLRKSCSPASV